QIAAGMEPDIDPYAAESPAEFFAVASEFFFDVPELLFAAQPDIYHLLTRLYRQDPLTRTRRSGAFTR
ncbi:MAG: zinc-dependent peptidase, partial [Wenzhouxiangellaceae bacterium]|nr:zinc-dependent peptidase [Wenzhouxiangellaceae bacterium]